MYSSLIPGLQLSRKKGACVCVCVGGGGGVNLAQIDYLIVGKF